MNIDKDLLVIQSVSPLLQNKNESKVPDTERHSIGAVITDLRFTSSE